jgi:hypothetical protein
MRSVRHDVVPVSKARFAYGSGRCWDRQREGWAVRRAQSDVGCTNALRTHEVPLIYINLPREERRNLASGA